MKWLLDEAGGMIAAFVVRRRLGIWNYCSWKVARKHMKDNTVSTPASEDEDYRLS